MEKNLNKNIKIGSKISLPSGSVLTVVTTFKHKGINKYTLKCSACSLDSELFPAGSIVSEKAALFNHYHSDGTLKRKQRIPCGCGLTTRWSEEQNRIRVERRSKLLNYVFTGFLEKYKGDTTRVSLYNPDTNNSFSVKLGRFLNEEYVDPFLGRYKGWQTTKLGTEVIISKLEESGVYPVGSVFTPVTGNMTKDLWKVSCPNCNTDRYSHIKSDFVFRPSDVIDRRSGSCRCTNPKNYRWTEKEREFQIKDRLQELGYPLICFTPNWFSSNYSEFEIVCDRGHKSIKTVANFIRKNREGSKCPICNRGSGGYDTSKSGTIYLSSWDKTYIKYGVTNNCHKERCKQQQRQSELSATVEYYKRSSDGQKIADIEKSIREYFGGYAASKSELPDGFTETLPYSKETLQSLINFIEKF